MKNIVYGFLDKDELERISQAIQAMETKTSGEIVVSVKQKRGLMQQKQTIRKLAENEFKRLKMGNTRGKTGILLFIIIKSKELTVLADSGIHAKVGDSAWEGIRDLLVDHFKKKLFSEGIIHAVTKMGELLAQHFPAPPDDLNELSNKVIVRR